MTKFWQKLGTFAACGLLCGGLAGGAFVGVKTGTEYVVDIVKNTAGNQPVIHSAQSGDSTQSGDLTREPEENNVSIGGQSVINITTDEISRLYDVADLAEAEMPTIVSITSTVLYQNPYAFFYGGSETYPVTGAGSGIIIGEDEERLLIVTNNHVVQDCNSLKVGFCDGSDIDASIVGTAPGNDLAVVSVQKSDMAADTLAKISIANLGDTESVRVGEPVMAIGNALGYGQSVTVGYVSALERDVHVNNSTIKMLQTDAAINEGNSGGALFNLQGQVIGINSAKASNSNNNVEGMCFAIPISDAIPVIENIINGNNNEIGAGRAYIGIQGKDLSVYDAASFNMPQGVYILAVVENGPAYSVGMRAGDIVTAIDDNEMSAMTDIKSYIANMNPGDVIRIRFARADYSGKYVEQEVEVTLGSYEE